MNLLIALLSLYIPSQIIADNITWILPPEYESVMEFHNGISAVKQNGRWGYVNSSGRLIVPCEYEKVYPFSEGMGVIASADNKLIGIVDTEGSKKDIPSGIKIDSRFAEFSDGLLLVTDGAKWGYLGKSGEMSIPCKYISALPFSEGLAGVLYEEYWYYIDPNNETMIPPAFQGEKKEVYWALGFKDGKALIVYSKNTGYIDKLGRPLMDQSPKLSPPDDAMYYKRSSLACREGDLIFDSKGCAVAYTDKEKNRFDLIKNESVTFSNKPIVGIPSEDVLWLSNDMAVCKIDGKSGIVKMVDEHPVQFSVDSVELNTFFGLPTTTKCTIAKGDALKYDDILIKQDDGPLTKCSLGKDGESDFLLSLVKSTDSPSEKKDVTISAWQYGLKLCEKVISFNLIDVPSITISDIEQSVTVNPEDKTYPIIITFGNTSNVAAEKVAINVNDESSIVSFAAGEKLVKQFSIPVTQSKISVDVKPQGSPIMNKTLQVTIQKKPVKNTNIGQKVQKDTTEFSGINSKAKNF